MRPPVRIIAPAAALLVASLVAPAQTIYVDCAPWSAPNPSLPSPSYGGPYGVPGVWNTLFLMKGIHALVDSSGNPTGVQAFVRPGCDYSVCTTSGLSGDDAALMEDAWNGDCYASPNIVEFGGLEAGVYQLLVIGYGACATSITTSVRVGFTPLSGTHISSGGVPFSGDWADFPLGKTSFTVSAGQTLYMTQWSSNYPGGMVGFQLVRLGDAPTPFCFGHLGSCPCATGAPGRGCASTFEPAGALLEGSGSASLATDTLVLTASDVGNGVVTFIQGSTLVADGFGMPFGSGLRCTGGLVRLVSRLAVNGVASYPGPSADPPISIKGQVGALGGFRGYQVWYRDPQDPCGAGFNMTNAVGVYWH